MPGDSSMIPASADGTGANKARANWSHSWDPGPQYLPTRKDGRVAREGQRGEGRRGRGRGAPKHNKGRATNPISSWEISVVQLNVVDVVHERCLHDSAARVEVPLFIQVTWELGKHRRMCLTISLDRRHHMACAPHVSLNGSCMVLSLTKAPAEPAICILRKMEVFLAGRVSARL
jgi:hypothetical protein